MYEEKDEVVQLFLDDIIPNRFQPREVFDEKALKELAVSIKEHGVIQPIIVRNVNGKYEIIAGERRYKASALAGLTKIPAIIRDLDDKESSKVALLENLQRKNLNPIEEARTYQKILELDQMTQEELAKTMGKSQSAVANKLRLLSLSDEIQDAILKEQISERHARALLNVGDTKVQKELVDKVIETKMSVRALEDEIKEMYPKGKDATDIPIEENAVASAGGFLDSTPLIPTANVIEEKTSNYGKVVIAPPKEMNEEESPKEEEEMPTGRFVNYGEIGKEDENTIERGVGGTSLPDIAPSIDVNAVRKTATDIKPAATSGAALDSLLNIAQPQQAHLSIEEKKQKEDYFSLPDLPNVRHEEPKEEKNVVPVIPNITNTITPETNILDNLDLPSSDEVINGDTYTVEEATKKINELVEDFKKHGLKVNADEMNFPKSYQVIIKIDKE